VARVRTIAGEVEIMPDTVALRRLERVEVDVAELERFMRELGGDGQ
jgi:hypothetical protein